MEQKITKAKHLSNDQRELFYQSKYDYYKSFNCGLLIVSTIAYLTFFFTDCGIFGRFAHETLLSRLIVVFPLLLFLRLYKQDKSYRIMVVASYLMVHIIIWCTDWATYLLPDRGYACEGMIIMNLIFVCAGFCAPYKWCIIAHVGLIVDILVANLFIKYDNVMMMIMFNAPCVIAVCVMHYIMENVYLDHYLVTEKLEELVVHDQLTGVYNRNKFKEITDPITEVFNIPKDIPLTLMMIDMDFFKKVNDQYGHESGDVVLKHLARVLLDSVRSSDYVIRWGGEEFLLLFSGYTDEDAINEIEKIRKIVDEAIFDYCGTKIHITLTFGVSSSTYCETAEHIIVDADKQLMKGKIQGKNRVVARNIQKGLSENDAIFDSFIDSSHKD